MTNQGKSPEGSSSRARQAWVVGVLVFLSGLGWGAFSALASWFCVSDGPQSVSYVLACLPALALCALGVALSIRSPIAVLLTPFPLVLSVLDSYYSACTGSWPYWRSMLFFTAVIPACAALALKHVDPEAARRGEAMAAAGWSAATTVRNLRRALWISVSASVTVLLLSLFRPVSTESLSIPSRGAFYPAGLQGRLAITRIWASYLPGGQPQLLGQRIERRFGPVQWTSRNAHPGVFRIQAVGHFPPEVYRRSYQDRLRIYQDCVADTTGARADERCIRDWSNQVAGILSPAEISWIGAVFRRGGFAFMRRYERQPMQWCAGQDSPGRSLLLWERGTGDILSPVEWNQLAGLLRRENFEVLSKTCEAFWWNSMRQSSPHVKQTECSQLVPGTEEEFSRVQLEWWCVRMRCAWGLYSTPPFWIASRTPCRPQGPGQDCVHEMISYLATADPPPSPLK